MPLQCKDNEKEAELRMQLYPNMQVRFPESAIVESEEAEGEFQR